MVSGELIETVTFSLGWGIGHRLLKKAAEVTRSTETPS